MGLKVTYPDSSVVHSLVSDYGDLVAPHCYRDATLEHSDEVVALHCAHAFRPELIPVHKESYVPPVFIFSPLLLLLRKKLKLLAIPRSRPLQLFLFCFTLLIFRSDGSSGVLVHRIAIQMRLNIFGP
jgi:hypothetical protein